MGACTFYNEVPGFTAVQDAFRHAVDQAYWEYGHAGYTGTICEKPGYQVFSLPPDMSATVLFEWLDALHGKVDELEDDDPLVKFYSRLQLRQLVETHNDKWGLAVAVERDGVWYFGGWASC